MHSETACMHAFRRAAAVLCGDFPSLWVLAKSWETMAESQADAVLPHPLLHTHTHTHTIAG
jgi:hypothetical protein